MDYWLKNLAYLNRQADSSTQAQAAEAAGIGQPGVHKILRGKTQKPAFETIVGLAKHYRVSLDDLVSRDLELDGPSAPSREMRLDTPKLASLIETVLSVVARSPKAKSIPHRAMARWIASLYAAQTGNEPQAAAAVESALSALLESWETT